MTQIEQYIERRKAELQKDTAIHPHNRVGRIKELDMLLAFLSEHSEDSGKLENVDDATMVENILGTFKTLEDMLDLTTSQDRDILESVNFEREWLKQRFNRVESVSPELGAEIDSYWNKATGFQPPFAVAELKKDDLAKVARHFYELGRKERSATSPELEDAAFDYSESCKYDGVEKLLCVEHFRAGAEWQKKQDHDECRSCEKSRDAVFFEGEKHAIAQMEKEAVEGVIFKPVEHYLPEVRAQIVPSSPFAKDEYKHGDKVKLIICKTDEASL